MSLAQIGEFSFIIAALGLSLKVTSDFLYPIAISVSAVTTFTTPYLIRSADQVVATLERRLPRHWITSLDNFRLASAGVSRTDEWRLYLKTSALKMLANGALVTAVFLLARRYVHGPLAEATGDFALANTLCLAGASFVSIPFVWGFAFGTPAMSGVLINERYRGPLVAFGVARWVLALALVSFATRLFAVNGLISFSVSLSLVFMIFIQSKMIGALYMRVEHRFVRNLYDREEGRQREMPPLAPWDSHLVELKISSESQLVGKSLAETTLRERFGITIALIERGQKRIAAPGRDEVLYPGDVLQVIGTDEQIQRFKAEVEIQSVEAEDVSFDYTLMPILVKEGTTFARKSIRECGLRESTRGLVVGIEKEGRRTLNPDSTTLIEPGDVLWVVGDRQLLNQNFNDC